MQSHYSNHDFSQLANYRNGSSTYRGDKYIFPGKNAEKDPRRTNASKSWQGTIDYPQSIGRNKCPSTKNYITLRTLQGRSRPLESVQDFLIKLDMKQCMHLLEISIFSLNLVIVRPSKIMNRADKNLKNQKFENFFK